jgi:type II secretory pathway predicted ATPase ExeA
MQQHWGLPESPFRGGIDPKSFYPSPTHEEALARLQFLVERQRRLGLLVGPSGSGKSLLLEVFAAQLRRNARPVAKLSLLGVEPVEMLWLLANDWG